MTKRNISRVLAVLMTCGLALGVAMMGVPALAAKKYKAQATSNVNLRKGPSSRAEKGGMLNKGEECILVAVVKQGRTVGDYTADMDFYKLSTGDYVAAKYIKWTEEIDDDSDGASSDGEDSSDDDDEDTTDIDDDDEDAGDDAADDGEDQEGLETVSDDDEDSSVDDAAEETEDDIPTESESSEEEEEAAAATVTATITTSALNVRTKPTSSSTSTKKLKKGETVQVTQYIKSGSNHNGTTASGNWYKLATGGFISADYVKVSGSLSAGASTAGATTTATKTVARGTATVNTTMYEVPSIAGAKKGTFKKGQTMNIKSSHAKGKKVGNITPTDNWYRLENGYYVIAKDVKVVKSTGSAGAATASATGVAVGNTIKAISNVNIRKGAGTNYGKAGLFVANQTDTVTEVSGSWVKLKKSGGYVSQDYVTVVGASASASTASSRAASTAASTDDDGIPVED